MVQLSSLMMAESCSGRVAAKREVRNAMHNGWKSLDEILGLAKSWEIISGIADNPHITATGSMFLGYS